MSNKLPTSSGWQAARLSAVPFAILVAVVLTTSLQVRADVTWTLPAGQSGDWSVATNWAPASVPTTFDIAYVTDGGTVGVTQLGETSYTLSLGGSAGSGRSGDQGQAGTIHFALQSV